MSASGSVKMILALSLLLNIGLGYKYVKSKYNYHPDYTFNRKELFEHLQLDSNSVVFAGNSLTAQFELAELFSNVHLRNRGLNGETSAGLLNRMPIIIQSHPRKIFIEIGINDIGENIPKTVILENYTKILSSIQQQSPASAIFVQSILPIYNAGPAVKNSGLSNNTIRDVNKSLDEYCKVHGITYINLYDKFELNGEMNPKYCIADGLHISGDGYLLWTGLLKPYVNQ